MMVGPSIHLFSFLDCWGFNALLISLVLQPLQPTYLARYCCQSAEHDAAVIPAVEIVSNRLFRRRSFVVGLILLIVSACPDFCTRISEERGTTRCRLRGGDRGRDGRRGAMIPLNQRCMDASQAG